MSSLSLFGLECASVQCVAPLLFLSVCIARAFSLCVYFENSNAAAL